MRESDPDDRAAPAPGSDPFSYLILRLVPSVERGESLNVGVVLFCRQRGFLGVRVALDGARLQTLAPRAPVREVAEHLAAVVRVTEGDADGGPIAALPQSDRFGWLAAPSSTIVQPSEVHTGLCVDPRATLDVLFTRLVTPAP
ncbi:MAG: DUF3037 domain-containing protein [Solirubrobacteraceae bacterium]